MKTAKSLAKSTIEKNILAVDFDWIFENIEYGVYPLGTDDEGWTYDISQSDHSEHGTVMLLGEYCDTDTQAHLAITPWLAKRVCSVDDWKAVVYR